MEVQRAVALAVPAPPRAPAAPPAPASAPAPPVQRPRLGPAVRVPLAPGPPRLVPYAAWPRVRAWTVVDAFEHHRHTVHVVAGERFQPHAVVRAARRFGHRPVEVLATSRVARAFTDAQLVTLVHDTLDAEAHGAWAVTLTDPLDMLLTEEVRYAQARVVLDDLLEAAQRLGRRVPVLIAQRPHRSPLMEQLRDATAAWRPPEGPSDGPPPKPAGRSAAHRPAWRPPRQATLDAFARTGAPAR